MLAQPQAQLRLVITPFHSLYEQVQERKYTLVRLVSPKDNIAYQILSKSQGRALVGALCHLVSRLHEVLVSDSSQKCSQSY
jgi:hypothetical protein